MKADVKSSGSAAPVAQPHHAGELGVSLFPQFSPDLLAGANNFFLLRERIKEIGRSTSGRFGEDVDGVDYKAIAFQIETAILANLLGSGKDVREGFLRAISLHLWLIEGGVSPNDPWAGSDAEAMLETSLAYSAFKPKEVSHV